MTTCWIGWTLALRDGKQIISLLLAASPLLLQCLILCLVM
ncbi:hypothetical protein LINPERHAP2_LOCUS44297 [Linum perenne]